MRISSSRFARAAVLLTGLAVLFPAPAAAQVISRLEGVVTDDAGNPLEGVEIYLRSQDTNATLKPAKTKKTGKYLYMAEPSTYIVYAKLEGYMVAREIADITNSEGGRSVNTWFFDDNQTFDKGIRLWPTGDLNSKVRNKIDFVLVTPDKHKETVNKLYAEYKGESAGGAAAPGAPAAAPAPEKKDPFEAAVDLIAQKDYAGAIPLLKEAIEKDPENADPYYQLGKASIETENYAEAEPALKKAKQLDATKPGVSFYLARLYDKKGRKIQAIQALEEERALTPDSETVLDNLAGLYAGAGQPEKAVENYEALITAHPDHFDAYMSLAALYKDLGNRAKEEEIYKKMSDRDPTGDSLYNLGNLAFNRSEHDKASVYYKKVLDKNPNHAKAHLQLGYTLVSLGDLAGAVRHLETFLKLSPKDPKAAEAKKTIDELKKLIPAGAKSASSG